MGEFPRNRILFPLGKISVDFFSTENKRNLLILREINTMEPTKNNPYTLPGVNAPVKAIVQPKLVISVALGTAAKKQFLPSSQQGASTSGYQNQKTAPVVPPKPIHYNNCIPSIQPIIQRYPPHISIVIDEKRPTVPGYEYHCFQSNALSSGYLKQAARFNEYQPCFY